MSEYQKGFKFKGENCPVMKEVYFTFLNISTPSVKYSKVQKIA